MRKQDRRVAFASLGATVAVIFISQTVRAADSGADALDEIVVTAQKRTEKLVDVPASIGVIAGDRLESMGTTSLAEFADYIPGLVADSGGTPGQNMIVIRGLTSSFENNTAPTLVATYIDDHAVGSSTNGARGAMFDLDLMPYDIERVEVLRGPQGTLYGANAMGGLIKYVLRKPDLGQYAARVGADIDGINGSGSPDFAVRGAVNVPIIADVLGIRLSAFGQHTAGYIDNVGLGVKDSNHSTISGGRGTLLWKPVDKLSIQGSVLYQEIDAADLTGVTVDEATRRPLYGWLKRSTLFPEPYTQLLRDYAVDLNWDLDFATLTSVSGLSRINGERGYDLTPQFGPFTPNNPDALARYALADDVTKYTEEVRLASIETQRIQWMLGGFYTYEKAEEDSNVPTYTPAFQPLPYNLLLSISNYAYHEVAVFGNTTIKLTDRFDVGGGVRFASNRQSFNSDAGGVFGSGLGFGYDKANVTTWSADARYHFDTQSMAYVRVATGYRPGGPNGANIPQHPTYNPDTLTNYEAGLKGEFLERRLQADISVFYINWKDIQLQLRTDQGLGYEGNGATARSAGVEISTSYLISEGLKLTATLDETDARLTQDAITSGGHSGDQLPVSPRWTGSLLADYVRPIGGDQNLSFGGGYRYRDAMLSQFAHSGYPAPLGPQDIFDLYAGYERNKLAARLYAKNVFDNKSYSGLLNITDRARPTFVPVQPRTIGLSLNYRF